MKKIAIAVTCLSFTILSGLAEAQSVSVKIRSDDPSLDLCSAGTVKGLKKSGDGFLAVRSGPGTKYKMKDKIYNGQRVLLCDGRGSWLGVIYTKKNTDCLKGIRRGRTTVYRGRCWNGWVHKNWIGDIAG